MNKDNAKDYLPLVQALADGKSIQLAAYFHYTGEVGGWVDVDELDTKVCATAYRIKPKPRVLYILLNRDGTRWGSTFIKGEAEEWAKCQSWHDGIIRKFVEVIED